MHPIRKPMGSASHLGQLTGYPRQLAGRPWYMTRLRRAAHRYAAHGWPVVPGAVWDGQRFNCGSDCRTVACHPDRAGWEHTASVDPGQIAYWWRDAPHALLLATGHTFDVLDLPGWLGHPLLAGPAGGPVVRMPTGRYLFLVRPGGTLRPRLANHAAVVLHGRGSWLPAPPTLLAEGPVRWLIAPRHTEWCLAALSQIQEAVLRVLADPPPPGPPTPVAGQVAAGRPVPQTA